MSKFAVVYDCDPASCWLYETEEEAVINVRATLEFEKEFGLLDNVKATKRVDVFRVDSLPVSVWENGSWAHK